jgi:hypothetical protein
MNDVTMAMYCQFCRQVIFQTNITWSQRTYRCDPYLVPGVTRGLSSVTFRAGCEKPGNVCSNLFLSCKKPLYVLSSSANSRQHQPLHSMSSQWVAIDVLLNMKHLTDAK